LLSARTRSVKPGSKRAVLGASAGSEKDLQNSPFLDAASRRRLVRLACVADADNE
jgi:hypothetical protein